MSKKSVLLLVETLEPGNFHTGIYHGFLAQKDVHVIPILIPRNVSFSHNVYDELILHCLNNFKIDILFSVQAEAINSRTIRACNNKGIKTIIWQVDDPYILTQDRNRSVHIRKIKKYQYIYTTNLESIETHYKKMGLQAKFLPFGFDSRFHRNLNMEKIYDLTFVGSPFPGRLISYIKPYKNINKNFLLFGSGNKLWNFGRITHENMVKIINQSKININFADQPCNSVSCLKNRVCEVLGSGQFLLSEDFPEARKMFTPDKNIVLFSNYREFKQKIRYYLENDKEREKIAKAGFYKVRNNYSYKKLIAKVLEEIKL